MPRKPREIFDIQYVDENLLTLLTPPREQYGLEIQESYEQATGQKLTRGTLYPALRRLENRGFIEGRWGDERPEERGGARRRYFQTTDLGQAALKRASVQRQRVTRWVAAWQRG